MLQHWDGWGGSRERRGMIEREGCRREKAKGEEGRIRWKVP